MLVLKIEENKRQELTQKGIVICTYIRVDNNKEVDAITMEYKDEYPNFEEVEVKDGGDYE
jgi:predicted secreted Zn-dependent protease